MSASAEKYSVTGFFYGQRTPMDSLSVASQLGVTLTDSLTRRTSLALDAMHSYRNGYNELDVTALVRVNVLRYRAFALALDAGFGWGHIFTTDRVDHNYHTYTAGLDCEYSIGSNWSIVSDLRSRWMTHNEHIGFNHKYGKFSVLLGIRKKFNL